MSSQSSPTLNAGESVSSSALARVCQREFAGVMPVEEMVPQGPAGRQLGLQ